MYEKFVYKHSETKEYVKNQPIFSEIYKLPGQIPGEFLGLRIRNFQGIVFYMNTNIKGDFQICISVTLT